MKERLTFLEDVGLNYLTLIEAEVSQEERHKELGLQVKLAPVSVGVTYVLDEPSIGLHQRNVMASH